jgi:hypothetical protein
MDPNYKRACALQDKVREAFNKLPRWQQTRSMLEAIVFELVSTDWTYTIAERVGEPPEFYICEYRGQL